MLVDILGKSLEVNMINLNHIEYLYVFICLLVFLFLKGKKKKEVKKRRGFPARHDPDDHPPTNFGSKGNRTQACTSLR